MNQLLLLGLTVFFPILMGALLPLFPFNRMQDMRRVYVMMILSVNAVLVALTLVNLAEVVTLLAFTEDLRLVFCADGLGKLFAVLIAIMWLAVGCYSFEYMKHEDKNERFYAFYLMTLGGLNGVCYSGNYMSLYCFFELMTLFSMPMVLHNQKSESLAAAKKYLIYSIFGASLGLAGFFFLRYYGTTTMFVAGGVLDPAKITGSENVLLVVALLCIIGFGAKGGMFPLHAWLPTAHPVAPACASAVLSGVITKAGVLAIIRVVFFQFGADFLRGTWVQEWWIMLALFTVFMGSMLAYKEKIFKKRLAYSTVSQVSYVLFGLACLNPVSMLGALLHVVAHSLIKDVLFMSAGAVIYRSGYTRVEQLQGIGQKMPWTMGLFTIASLGLIGIPPLLGFVSKWYLAEGSLRFIEGTLGWAGPAILLVSALLTAGYLFSITINAYCKPALVEMNFEETTGWMLVPMAMLVGGIILLGMFPAALMPMIQNAITNLF